MTCGVSVLAGFDPATVPSQTLTHLNYPVDSQPLGAEQALGLIPLPYGYPRLPFEPSGAPGALSALGAAALSAYMPANALNFNTAGFAKVIGYLAMAGDYCLKTYTLNTAGQLVGSPTCISGRGSCSSWFKVSPSTPYVAGENTYVLAMPNRRCGS